MSIPPSDLHIPQNLKVHHKINIEFQGNKKCHNNFVVNNFVVNNSVVKEQQS